MQLKGGEVVSLIHYSGKYTLMGIVYLVSNEFLEIIPFQQQSLFSFFENDPVVIGYKISNEFYLCECIICKVDLSGHRIGLKINAIKSNADKRLFERFPVSLRADVQDQNGVGVAFVKNISIGGVGMMSQRDFPINEAIQIDLDIDKTIVSLRAKIVWKKHNENFIEYGLHFIYLDEQSKKIITAYIQTLKDEHERNLKKFKIAYKKKKITTSEETGCKEACS